MGVLKRIKEDEKGLYIMHGGLWRPPPCNNSKYKVKQQINVEFENGLFNNESEYASIIKVGDEEEWELD